MRKRNIPIIAILAMMLATSIPSAKAQIFLDNEDLARQQSNGELNLPNVPQLGVTYDQYQENEYVPVGEGIVLLAGLAGAYLIGKRKEKRERLSM